MPEAPGRRRIGVLDTNRFCDVFALVILSMVRLDTVLLHTHAEFVARLF